MKNNFLLLAIFFCMAMACKKNTVEISNYQTQIFQAKNYFIQPAIIYYQEAVLNKLSNFIVNKPDSIEIWKKQGKTFFEKAKNLEKSNLQQSIFYCQRTLTCIVSPAVYKKLGDLLLQAHQQQEAADAYEMSKQLLESKRQINNKEVNRILAEFDKFLGMPNPNLQDLYRQLIQTRVASKDYENAMKNIIDAYDTKIISKEFILTDNSMQKFRESSAFEHFYLITLAEGAEKDIAMKKFFLKDFDKQTLPYTVSITPPRKQYSYSNGDKYIEPENYYDNPVTEKYEQMLKPADTYISLKPIAQLHENSNYTLLLVAYDTTSIPSATDNFRTFTYILFSLDKQGNFIDKMPVAYRTPFTEASANITETGFEIKIFDRIWKNKEYFKAQKNNELLSVKLVDTKNYSIDANGKFK